MPVRRGWRIVASALVLAATPAPAQQQPAQEPRLPSAEYTKAAADLNYTRALTVLRHDLAACEARPRFAVDCLYLMNTASGEIIKLGGSAHEGEATARRALAIALAHLGDSHPETAHSYNNIAYNLKAQGRYADAEPLYRKALDIDLALFGARDPRTAVGYNNLAANLFAQRRRAEAEPLFREVLRIHLASRGENDPGTATSYNNLANILTSQSRYAEADSLFRKALAIHLALFGERHPATAHAYNNLAVNSKTRGRYEEAEHFYRKALDIRLAVLGERHRDTGRSYYSFASLLGSLRRYPEATQHLRKAIEIDTAILDRLHPDLISARTRLAGFEMRPSGNVGDALVQLRIATAAITERTRGAGMEQTAADEAERYRVYFSWQVRAAWRVAHTRASE